MILQSTISFFFFPFIYMYKWKTLSHNGVLFPPPYTPHNVPVIYNGQEVKLSPEAEEAATLYTKYLNTEYIKSSTFRRNFWKDWKKLLGASSPIKDLENVNFSLIYEHLYSDSRSTGSPGSPGSPSSPTHPSLPPPDIEKYKTALLDGSPQPVGNFRIEPPSLFIGRGSHPLLGRIKKRISPSDITINIGKESLVPDSPNNIPWKKVIHDRTVVWLASWNDTITGKIKYVWLGNKSTIKANSDKEKYNLAHKLHRKIRSIRENNYKLLSDPNPQNQQLATALYLIDKLALRVGNEKNTDIQADTVGTTTLLVSNIQLHDFNKISLNFLGKDSIKYSNTVTVDPLIHVNLNKFMLNKTKDDQLFDLINPTLLNKYLQSYMDGLTAKVFRTFNASYTFQKELNKISENFTDGFKNANLKVAILCNHQKQVPKSFSKSIEKINERIKELRKKSKGAKGSKGSAKGRIKEKIKELKLKKKEKNQLKGIALQTSMDNYIDPRITVAFTKKHKLDISKFFSKKQMEQFWWAMDTDENYKF